MNGQMNSIKETLKALLPRPVAKVIQKYRTRDKFKEYRNLPTQAVFAKIYESAIWGRSDDPSQPFFSGSGSHDDAVVSAYLGAVQEFLKSFDRKPNVVDLGCGDFFVGSKIRPLCDKYTACDIVPRLIEFNKEKFEVLNVDFRVMDLTTDELPAGDVVFIRQVFQHLSNEQILRVLPEIASKYKYLVLTEHLPGKSDFEHNLDKPAGPDIRTGIESGIVLTSPPFNFKPKGERLLCKAGEAGGLIVTTLFTLI
jgi:hypothetical protein